MVCYYDQKYSKPAEIYRGEDAIERFLEKMFEEVRSCQKVMREHFVKPLEMTASDERDFQNSTSCHICEKKYKPEEYNLRVRDHCHITGKYRGSAHNNCNLKLQIEPEKIKIPVIFHNLKGYDCHFIMQKIRKMINDKSIVDTLHIKSDDKIIEQNCTTNISVIANNFEKYMSFRLGRHLQFIDSFNFMGQSLDRLASNLSEDSFIYSKEPLLREKGVYPYDYMDGFNRFHETSLPKREDFYSQLYDENISEEQYKHAQKVWDAFEIKNLGEYHDLYLKSDVLLLADVFESFRKTCLNHYGLDPAHYMSSPRLSWDAMLKKTGIWLELITDIDMQFFIEKGMRGGISYIAHRYGKANNKYMKDYNPKEESSYLMYLDANNLYGWAMSQPLPYGNFKWMHLKEGDFTDHTKKGIILEVDLEYPDDLHDPHNDYPCAPEKIIVTEEMLSDYCKNIKKLHGNSSGRVSKLVPTLQKKERYVLHYKNLKLYESLGLKVSKVHRVLEFSQKPWLKPYIDFNTEMRKGAKNSFEKDFFKLMNNSVFGKTLENLRKRSNIQLITDAEQLLRLTSEPTFVNHKIFNENLVGINMEKEKIKLDKPSFVGMCILDLSKTLMYDFHYNYIRKKYTDCQLLFTDTDSLFYHIKTEDAYEDFYRDKELFDNSDYSETSKYFSKENKKVIGKFKDEAAGRPILEFIGLKSKMYSYTTEEKNNKTAKGVKKNVIRKEIKHSDC